MPSLVNIAEAKKASDQDIIITIRKLTDILSNREENRSDYDMDQVFRNILNQDIYSSPDNIRDIFVVNNSMIAIPSILPEFKDGKISGGKSVVPVIQIPGSDPYYAYQEDTETFIESQIMNLRGLRGANIHKVIPGMVVSFHHYETRGEQRIRTRIDVIQVVYDTDNNLSKKTLTEEEAPIRLPSKEDYSDF